MLVQANVGSCVGGRPEYTAGQGEGKRWILPYGWKKGKREKWKGGEEEGEKEETQQCTSTHLMLPAGPRDADSTVLLIHSPFSN